MGIRLANSLGVGVGDSISLVAPKGASTPFGTAPRIKRYRISAIFELGMSEYDKTMVFMPLVEAQKYFSRGDEVDVLEVLTESPDHVDGLMEPLKAAGGPTLHFSDWRKRNETFFTVLEVERNVMFIILSLIVLVAALNIISGIMMLVKEKARDIAILRTMGATEGRDHARVPDYGGVDRGGRDDRRAHPRHRVLLEHREYPPGRCSRRSGTKLMDPAGVLSDTAAGAIRTRGRPPGSW